MLYDSLVRLLIEITPLHQLATMFGKLFQASSKRVPPLLEIRFAAERIQIHTHGFEHVLIKADAAVVCFAEIGESDSPCDSARPWGEWSSAVKAFPCVDNSECGVGKGVFS